MKGLKVIFFANACLLILGSGARAQEVTSQLPTTIVEQPAEAVYRNQANVAQSRMMNERELSQAARLARIDKELKAAMAAQGMSRRPPVITTGAQFLEANKPPPAPPSDRPEPRRGGEYVPPFLIPEDPTGSSAPVKPETEASAENAMVQSTQGDLELPKQKGGFFSRLFGRKKADKMPEAVPAMPSEYPTGPQDISSAPSESSMPPETAPEVAPFEIPDAPAMNEAPAPAPAPAPPTTQASTSGASIFKGKKAATDSGSKLTVISEVDANVSGVLVKLFKGDQVEMLGQTGSLARIRLKDQRVGTVAASALR